MSLTGVSANRLELLQIADAVAREKAIDKEIVIEAIEDAIVKGATARYGADHDIRARIDVKTGELTLTRHVTVVADDWEPEEEGEMFVKARKALSQEQKDKLAQEMTAFLEKAL